MLRRIKLLVLDAARGTGASFLVLNSPWRHARLLILCYHGISLADEHEWNPELFIPPPFFEHRLATLRSAGCNVLPLEEGVRRLREGTLPPRAVAITFDDGLYDFYSAAAPLLRKFGYPATVYLTTYYSQFNRPVFDVMCSYLLWKAAGRRLDWPRVFPEPVILDEPRRATATLQLLEYARRERLSGLERDALLDELACHLAIDLDDIRRRRILHLMTPAEARDVAAAGGDIQLHTHRHRVSRDRDRFWREIDDNRRSIAEITSKPTRHFCYPGGFHLPEFPAWLRERGIETATTCNVGMATRGSNPLLLPRLIDHSGLTDAEFLGWLSGIASVLPRRPHVMADGQLLEES